MPQKLLIIGLDGASWSILRPLINKGFLPTFKKLFNNGESGILKSTIPPWTIPAWESLLTGKSPRSLNLPTFFIRNGYNFNPYLFDYKTSKNFLDILSIKNKIIIAANLPNITDAYPINGYMISGWFNTNEDKLCYPKDLVNNLEKIIKQKYIIDIVGEAKKEKKRVLAAAENNNKYLNQLIKLTKIQTAFYLKLLKKNWDLTFLVYTATDRIQHRTWDQKSMQKIYQKIDTSLEKIIKIIGKKTNILIMSDHGFGPIDKIFNLNEWLIKNKYLTLVKNKENSIVISPSLKKIKDVYKNKFRFIYNLSKSLLKYFPILQKKLSSKLKTQKILETKIDWSKTKAWAVGPWGAIYINLQNRDPQGIVKAADYHKIKNQIRIGLGKIDSKIKIYDPKNNLKSQNPDLFIIPTNKGVNSISTDIGIGKIFSKGSGGQHRINGIYIAKGKKIEKYFNKKTNYLTNISSYILQYFKN